MEKEYNLCEHNSSPPSRKEHSCAQEIKYAGYYHDDIAYNPDTDKMDLRKIKIICPGCQREFAALLSKHTEKIRLIMIGCDYDIPVVEMKSYCIQCKTAFTFKLDCS